MSAIAKQFNYADGKGRIEVKFNAADELPAELMIYEVIGEDPWDGKGITALDVQAAVKEVMPQGRALNFRINSRGGDVFEGLAIRSFLSEYPGEIIETVDGVAASTASWMIPADKVVARKHSQIFIHDAWGICVGNADAMAKQGKDLDTTSQQIAEMYSEKSGVSAQKMRKLMKDETLLTGQAALDLGLVDELLDQPAESNFTDAQVNAMKNKLALMRNSLAAVNRDSTTNPAPAVAGANLNQSPVTATANSFPAASAAGNPTATAATNGTNPTKTMPENAPVAATPPVQNNELDVLKKQVEALTAQNNEARRLRISNEIDRIIANDQLPAAMKDKAVDRALKDETYLNELAALPVIAPGAPSAGPSVEITSENLKDVSNFVAENTYKFREQFIGAQNAQKTVDEKVCREITSRSVAAANVIQKHLNKIVGAWNTNTIDANLKRQVILQVPVLKAFKRRIIPLTSFANVFNNVPLEGTDKVDVAFYPLQTAASTAFNGTYSAGNTSVESREVTISNRLYQMFAFTSSELRRLPYVNWEQLGQQNGDKLGYDVFANVVGNITAANFGASVKAVPAAAFSADDVADLYSAAAGANWPDAGRALTLNHTYKAALLKDPAFKQYLSYGDTDPIRKAAIQEAYGFENIHTIPNLTALSPANENLVGWINHLSALLVATSPIMPSEDVRAVMSRYDVITDPDTGLSIEYRRWGSPSTDSTNEVVECNFGVAKGVAEALARITSA